MQNPWKEFRNREEYETLSLDEQMAEEMILGLRMTEGVSKEAFLRRYGVSVDSVYGEIVEKHKQNGLITEKNNAILFTKNGLDLSNIVLCDFV